MFGNDEAVVLAALLVVYLALLGLWYRHVRQAERAVEEEIERVCTAADALARACTDCRPESPAECQTCPPYRWFLDVRED